MTYPVEPNDAYDYESFQADNPTTPLPSLHVTDDFANHKTAIDACIDFIKQCFSSTGLLAVASLPGAEDLTAYTQQAIDSATSATASASAASVSAAAAAASAASAASLTGTSTTSVAIGTGSKTWTTQAAKQFAVGEWLVVSETATPTNYCFGQVTAYNSGTGSLTVNVTAVGGSGTIAAWTISVSGIQGAKGDTGAAGAAGTPGSSGSEAIGTVRLFTGRIAEIPSGNLPLNGVAVSRATYPDLFALWVKSDTFTVTIANPAVVSWSSHGLDDGDPFVPTTDGALPTGLTPGTTYYVKAVDADSFQLTNVPGGTAVITTGTQSGTHTGTSALCGLGDGSTTFNTQDWRGASPVGHDMMGTTAAGNLAFADTGIYGRGNGQIAGANSDPVVNTQHSHSYGSARVTTTVSAETLSGIDGEVYTTVVTALDNAGSGTSGVQGTASQKYKRVGRVAVGIWIVRAT